MKTEHVIQFFGTKAAVAKAVGISRAAVCQWGEFVPLATAAKLEKLTDGGLRLELQHYQKAA